MHTLRIMTDFWCPTRRCAVVARFSHPFQATIKIAAVHLCGGRFDDAALFGTPRRQEAKVTDRTFFLHKIIKERPDVIMGDFNSDPNDDRYRTATQRYSPARSRAFRKWQTDIYVLLKRYNYIAPALSGPTSVFGTQVDSIYIRKPLQFKTAEIVPLDGGFRLTDHHGVFAELSNGIRLFTINLQNRPPSSPLKWKVAQVCRDKAVDVVATQETNFTIPDYDLVKQCLTDSHETVALFCAIQV